MPEFKYHAEADAMVKDKKDALGNKEILNRLTVVDVYFFGTFPPVRRVTEDTRDNEASVMSAAA